jgi:hypothetical protein
MRLKRFMLIAMVVMLISSCAIEPKIHSDYNRSIDFNQYESFGFYDQVDTEHGYETLVTQYLKKITIVELTKRGLSFSEENPDLLINFHTNVEQKQKIYKVPSYDHVGYYDYRVRRYYYDPWPEYEIRIDNYEEGTLNIDMVERKSTKMIWEGVAIGRLTKKNKENMQLTIENAVVEIFRQFPITAPIENDK